MSQNRVDIASESKVIRINFVVKYQIRIFLARLK